MTTQEFSSRFDVLLNSYSEGQIVLDEYEKSVLLTKALWQVVRSLYSGGLDASFESSEENRRYLANLVNEATLTPTPQTVDASHPYIYDKVYNVTLPEGIGFITMELAYFTDEVSCEKKRRANVQPVTQDEYNIIRKNPFRGANDNRVLRMDIEEDKIQLITKHLISKYYVRYLMKPSPIVLTYLPEDLSIEGCNEPTECELNSLLHDTILEFAVNLAIATRGTGTKTKREKDN